eukprot:g74392.t1
MYCIFAVFLLAKVKCEDLWFHVQERPIGDYAQVEESLAYELAVQHVNDKTDGFFDELLPNITLHLYVNNSPCSANNLIMTNQTVHGIIYMSQYHVTSSLIVQTHDVPVNLSRHIFYTVAQTVHSIVLQVSTSHLLLLSDCWQHHVPSGYHIASSILLSVAQTARSIMHMSQYHITSSLLLFRQFTTSSTCQYITSRLVCWLLSVVRNIMCKSQYHITSSVLLSLVQTVCSIMYVSIYHIPSSILDTWQHHTVRSIMYISPPAAAVVGPACSGGAGTLAAVCGAVQIPLVSHAATAPGLTGVHPYFSRTSPSDRIPVNGTVAFVRLMGWKRVATLTSSDPFDRAWAEWFSTTLLYYEPNASVANFFTPRGDNLDHLASVMSDLNAWGARIILLSLSSDDAGAFLEAVSNLLKQQGRPSYYYTWLFTDWMDTWLPKATGEQLEVAQGAIFLTPLTPSSQYYSADKTFYNRWKQSWDGATRNHVVETIYTPFAYDAVIALAQAFTAVQLLGFFNDSPFWGQGPKVLSALRQTSFEGASGKVYFGPIGNRPTAFLVNALSGNTLRPVAIFTLQEELLPLDSSKPLVEQVPWAAFSALARPQDVWFQPPPPDGRCHCDEGWVTENCSQRRPVGYRVAVGIVALCVSVPLVGVLVHAMSYQTGRFPLSMWPVPAVAAVSQGTLLLLLGCPLAVMWTQMPCAAYLFFQLSAPLSLLLAVALGVHSFWLQALLLAQRNDAALKGLELKIDGHHVQLRARASTRHHWWLLLGGEVLILVLMAIVVPLSLDPHQARRPVLGLDDLLSSCPLTELGPAVFMILFPSLAFLLLAIAWWKLRYVAQSWSFWWMCFSLPGLLTFAAILNLTLGATASEPVVENVDELSENQLLKPLDLAWVFYLAGLLWQSYLVRKLVLPTYSCWRSGKEREDHKFSEFIVLRRGRMFLLQHLKTEFSEVYIYCLEHLIAFRRTPSLAHFSEFVPTFLAQGATLQIPLNEVELHRLEDLYQDSFKFQTRRALSPKDQQQGYLLLHQICQRMDELYDVLVELLREPYLRFQLTPSWDVFLSGGECEEKYVVRDSVSGHASPTSPFSQANQLNPLAVPRNPSDGSDSANSSSTLRSRLQSPRLPPVPAILKPDAVSAGWASTNSPQGSFNSRTRRAYSFSRGERGSSAPNVPLVSLPLFPNEREKDPPPVSAVTSFLMQAQSSPCLFADITGDNRPPRNRLLHDTGGAGGGDAQPSPPLSQINTSTTSYYRNGRQSIPRGLSPAIHRSMSEPPVPYYITPVPYGITPTPALQQHSSDVTEAETAAQRLNQQHSAPDSPRDQQRPVRIRSFAAATSNHMRNSRD